MSVASELRLPLLTIPLPRGGDLRVPADLTAAETEQVVAIIRALFPVDRDEAAA